MSSEVTSLYPHPLLTHAGPLYFLRESGCGEGRVLSDTEMYTYMYDVILVHTM